MNWVDFSIDVGGRGFSEPISCIFPVFRDCCAVLAAATEGLETKPLVFCAEPNEYELHFVPNVESEAMRLVVREWPSAKRSSLCEPRTILDFEDSRLEVVVPFWRALRKLQASLPANPSEGDWKHEFPVNELRKLTLCLQSLKADEISNKTGR